MEAERYTAAAVITVDDSCSLVTAPVPESVQRKRALVHSVPRSAGARTAFMLDAGSLRYVATIGGSRGKAPTQPGRRASVDAARRRFAGWGVVRAGRRRSASNRSQGPVAKFQARNAWRIGGEERGLDRESSISAVSGETRSPSRVRPQIKLRGAPKSSRSHQTRPRRLHSGVPWYHPGIQPDSKVTQP